MNLQEKLFELQDEKYKKFHSGLCPNVDNIIGVQIPKLRTIAKEIAKENPKEFLNNIQAQYYEEKVIYGLVIGYMKADLQTRQYYLDKFVPLIDSWAVCDCCVSSFKFVNKYKEEMWKYTEKYLKSNNEFELRFAVVLLMDYYLTEEYIDKVLEIYNNIKNDAYYVKMAVAWALSFCYIKFPDKTIKLFKKNQLDDFTYNKALQKIIESNRISKEEKDKIRKMKKNRII